MSGSQANNKASLWLSAFLGDKKLSLNSSDVFAVEVNCLPLEAQRQNTWRIHLNQTLARLISWTSSPSCVGEAMTFIVDIKVSTLHLCLIHDHTPAIRAHQIHIIRQLFSHLIALLQLPRRLLPPATLPAHTLIHWKARLELTDRGPLSRVTIKLAFWHNGCT